MNIPNTIRPRKLPCRATCPDLFGDVDTWVPIVVRDAFMDGECRRHPPSGKICIELFHRKVQLYNVCQRILAADMANNTFHRTGNTGGIIWMICPVVHSRFNENEIKFAFAQQVLLDAEGVPPLSADDARSMLARDLDRWTKLVRAAGIKAE